MKIPSFIEKFNLHDSSIENLGYEFFKDQLIMTVNFCNWAQENFKEGKEPDHYIGNFIFKGVSDLRQENIHFFLMSNQILEVEYKLIENDLVKIDFRIMILDVTIPFDIDYPIETLSFIAKEVEWCPFEVYNDQ